jgi:FkbM family methyltransferase
VLQLKTWAKSLVNTAGFDLHRYLPQSDDIIRVVKACERRNIAFVLDVGANVGQFGMRLRERGYKGRIVSFEPLSKAHSELTRAAARDDNWLVPGRAAVGDINGYVTINVADNSWSSSILPILGAHLQGAPDARYIGQETVPIITLEYFLRTSLPLSEIRLALKVDVQGYEDKVLKGLADRISCIDVLFLEMSLVQLYDGATPFIDMYNYITSHGFTCISLSPAFVNPNTFEVEQLDGLFERRPRDESRCGNMRESIQ